MANEQPADVLSDVRTAALSLHQSWYEMLKGRDRFNALGGTPAFQGAGKLFAADGSGQEIPFSDFLGLFNAMGAMEGDSEWPAFLAVIARSRA
jgi:hypothetical protein